MKICAIICEFNPFHNGHAHIISSAKKLTGCDAVLCLMSGNFTQRGDMCVMDKFTRAKHAVLSGADAVLELPVSFSVAPAEIFAKGAVKILSSIPAVTHLCFGCENVDANFERAAEILAGESGLFKEILKKESDKGESYIKSYCAAFEACGGDSEILAHPNNILGVEYTKAVRASGADIKTVPIERDSGEKIFGAGNKFTSSALIRENPCIEEIKYSVPPAVYGDLHDISAQNKLFADLLRSELIKSQPELLKKIYGCTEGLENALIKYAHLPYGEIIGAVCGKRYTRARIKRILLANLLKLYKDDAESYLGAEKLYIKPITIEKSRKDYVLPALSEATFPLVLQAKNLNLLTGTAEKCYKSDKYANKIHNFIFGKPDADFDYPIFI